MNEPSQETLSEHKKERIRREEIFRNEVRKELERRSVTNKSRLLAALNQPFTLWLLSTVVVGLLSFSYTNWRESQDAASASRQFASEVQREIEYRIRQVDRVLAEAKEAGDGCIDTLVETGGRIRGQRIHDYFESSKQLTVVSRLGGIFQFPPPDKEGSATVWIGSGGYGYRHIPFKRGFRSEQFANDHLGDLVHLWYSSRGRIQTGAEKAEIDEALAKFEDATEYTHTELLKDWRARHQAIGKYKLLYGSAYSVFELDVEDYEDELRRVHEWVGAAAAAWEAVKLAAGT